MTACWITICFFRPNVEFLTRSEVKTIRFKIFTLEIKWILYFFLAYLKIWNVSLQSILKTKTFFKKSKFWAYRSVFSLLIFAKKWWKKPSTVRKFLWHNFSITFSKAFGTMSLLLWTAVAADLYFIGRVTRLIMDHVQFQVTKCKQIFTCNTMYHTSTIISLPTEEYTTLLYMPISWFLFTIVSTVLF